jgi:hypothetical protein
MTRDIGALAAQLDDPRDLGDPRVGILGIRGNSEILGSGVAGAVVGIRTPWS